MTAAFALTPRFRRAERSLLLMRDQGTALLVFLVLGLVEEATVSHAGWLNERIVVVCAAGLLAGPWVGLAVSVFVTWLAVAHDGLPLGSIATAMLCGGLVGGWLYQWRPRLAQHPLTGFCLTLGVSSLRSGLILFFAPRSPAALHTLKDFGMPPVLQALGTALILTIVEQVRERDEQTEVAALAETRALQARINPYFLFNALNAWAALSKVAPRQVPRVTGQLRQFLRASFDQHERPLVPLEEELAVVSAYLEIERLRLGDRLKVEQTIDPDLLKVLIPPFSLQPLVENAVQQGVDSSTRARRIQLLVRATGRCLEVSVNDDGQGVPSTEIEQRFIAEGSRVHAPALLRRRLQELFVPLFQLEVRSETSEGTTVTMRIPLRKQFGDNVEALRVTTSELRTMALNLRFCSYVD